MHTHHNGVNIKPWEENKKKKNCYKNPDKTWSRHPTLDEYPSGTRSITAAKALHDDAKNSIRRRRECRINRQNDWRQIRESKKTLEHRREFRDKTGERASTGGVGGRLTGRMQRDFGLSRVANE